MSSIFFQFLKPFPDGVCLLKTMENESAKHVKYAWKSVNKICSKSTIKAQEQHRRCGCVVFIINLGGADIEDQSNIYVETFFAIQGTKANIFNWVLNIPLKLSADFTFIN